MHSSYLIDTHAHPSMIIDIEKKKYAKVVEHQDIIENARDSGVQEIFCVSTNISDFCQLRTLSKQFDPYYFSIGVHPCDVGNNFDYDVVRDTIDDAVKKREKIVGIGETGIDLYHKNDADTLEKQREVFLWHIESAMQYNLPLIVHSRNATEITYSILKSFQNSVNGVIHAYSDDISWAKKFVDIGFYLGIGAVISYPKNDYIRNVVKCIGVDHIVLETDSPFLPLQSMRGKTNYPGYVAVINELVADLCNKTAQQTQDIIYHNTKKIFFV